VITIENIEDWRGQRVLDPADEQLGKLEDIYFDRDSGTPLLALVKSGLMGRRAKLIPLDGATVGRDHVRLVHGKEAVDAAPDAPDEAPDHAELDKVAAAYGLKFSDRVTLETADQAARRAEAQAARDRADQLSITAREKIAARDAAQRRAQNAGEDATQAEREAEEAREAALQAREEAQRYDED